MVQAHLLLCQIEVFTKIENTHLWHLLKQVEVVIFSCEFCAIHSYYEKKYYRRPVEEVVQDIKNSGKKYVFFIDDNFVADHNYALEICKAIAPLKIKWVTQGAITMAKNDELLYWMKKNECFFANLTVSSKTSWLSSPKPKTKVA